MEEANEEWAGVSGQISASREEVKREVARVEQTVEAMAADQTKTTDQVMRWQRRLMKANQQQLIMQQLFCALNQI